MSENELWEPFANRLQSLMDIAPGDVKAVVGYLDDKQHAELFGSLRGSPDQSILGNRKSSLFPQGRGAILEYPNEKVKKWVIDNGRKHGIDVDRRNPAFVFPLGKRAVKPGAGFNDLLDYAFGTMMYEEQDTFSPELKRAQQADGTQEGFASVHPLGGGTADDATFDAQYMYSRLRTTEGIENEIYLDGLKNKTVGIGHLIDEDDPLYNKPVGYRISDEEVQRLYEEDFASHAPGAMILPDFDSYSIELKEKLVDFVFNIGPNAFGLTNPEAPAWPTMLAFLLDGDFEGAANEVYKDWGVPDGGDPEGETTIGKERRDGVINALLREATL